MIHQAKPTFRHKHNIGGALDSICCKCALTVASATVEHQLAQRRRSTFAIRIVSIN